MNTEKKPWIEAAQRISNGVWYPKEWEDIIREACETWAKLQPCPHVICSPDDTSYCTLAEKTAGELSRMVEENAKLRATLDTALRDYKAYAEENERLHRTCVNREESLERAQRQAAAMREALEKVWAEDECGYITGGDADECVKCGAVASTKALMLKAHSEDCTQAILERALATDAGQDFVPMAEVDKLVGALERALGCAYWEGGSAYLGELSPHKALAAWKSKHGGKEKKA